MMYNQYYYRLWNILVTMTVLQTPTLLIDDILQVS
jgi:hypothetical protein